MPPLGAGGVQSHVAARSFRCLCPSCRGSASASCSSGTAIRREHRVSRGAHPAFPLFCLAQGGHSSQLFSALLHRSLPSAAAARIPDASALFTPSPTHEEGQAHGLLLQSWPRWLPQHDKDGIPSEAASRVLKRVRDGHDRRQDGERSRTAEPAIGPSSLWDRLSPQKRLPGCMLRSSQPAAPTRCRPERSGSGAALTDGPSTAGSMGPRPQGARGASLAGPCVLAPGGTCHWARGKPGCSASSRAGSERRDS